MYPSSPFPPHPEGQETGFIRSLKNVQTNQRFFLNDAAFDWLYPGQLQLISLKHWTPLAVARAAAAYLAIPGSRVLDVGSGIGKFCLTAAHAHPQCFYYGAEQRADLVQYADRARDYLQLPNATFLHANITQVDFAAFDHFYFYNAFYENIDSANAIDDAIETSRALYDYYNIYFYHALKQKPAGTRVVTYQREGDIIPSEYRLSAASFDRLLELWIRD